MDTTRDTTLVGSTETLARSVLLRLLSQALAYPTALDVDRLLWEDVPLARSMEQRLPEGVRRALEAFAATLEGATARSLEERYTEVFTHVHSGDCPAYETDHGPRDVWRQADALADIAGFYRAFGFDPVGERADHASVELEFLHALAYKEAWATAHGDEANAGVCRRAAIAFERDHALRWLSSLAGRIRLLASDGPYAACARLLSAWCIAESQRLDVPLPDDVPAAAPSNGSADDAPGFCEVET